MLRLIGFFLAGLFLINGIPHFVQGICGKSHMTPFARVSRPVTNVIWGLINFIIGEGILRSLRTGSLELSQIIAFWLGGTFIAICLSIVWSNPEARLPWHKD